MRSDGSGKVRSMTLRELENQAMDLVQGLVRELTAEQMQRVGEYVNTCMAVVDRKAAIREAVIQEALMDADMENERLRFPDWDIVPRRSA